jgi:ribosome-associated protein
MASSSTAPDATSPGPPLSKTRRKHAMLALQDLGERLVSLSDTRLAELALPEALVQALREARRMTRHEARRRQMQYIGRLMREVDPEPIEARLAAWANAPNAEKARLAAVERWRDRLMNEAGALEALCLERPGADREALAALIVRADAERRRGTAPHAYRALFRALNVLLAPQ